MRIKRVKKFNLYTRAHKYIFKTEKRIFITGRLWNHLSKRRAIFFFKFIEQSVQQVFNAIWRVNN